MKKIFSSQSFGLLTLAGFIAAMVASTAGVASAQAANSIYLSAASGSYTVGDSFTVSVRVNTSDQINAVGARLSYNENLQFVSIDGAGSAFGVDANSAGGGGSVTIDRGTVSPVSGDQLLTKINFKAVVAGNGSVQMLAESEALSASTNQNVLTARNGGVYTVAAASSGSSGSTGSGATSPSPSGASSSNNQTTNKKPNTKTTIAPQGNATPAPLPGDSSVELSAPATVETVTDEAKEAEKVEYLLNGKLVNTDTTPPFSYKVDTTNLANGKYELTTKTYYKDGTVDSSTASLLVKNAFGPKQFWLQFKRYIWLVIILLVVAAGLMYLKMYRGGRGASMFKFGKGKEKGPDASGHGAIVVGGSGTQSTMPPTINPTIPPTSTPGAPPSSQQNQNPGDTRPPQ